TAHSTDSPRKRTKILQESANFAATEQFADMIGVTGANGLLGSFIIRKLIKEKAAFIAFKRRSADISLLSDVEDKIEWRELDLQNPISMDGGLQGIKAVIHAAAIVSFNPRNRDLISHINTVGTRNLINACLSKGVKRF